MNLCMSWNGGEETNAIDLMCGGNSETLINSQTCLKQDKTKVKNPEATKQKGFQTDGQTKTLWKPWILNILWVNWLKQQQLWTIDDLNLEEFNKTKIKIKKTLNQIKPKQENWQSLW